MLNFVFFCWLDITPGFTEFWADGTDTSDIKILTGELSYTDWLIVNGTLWDPVNIDNTTGQPSMLIIIDGWSKIFILSFVFLISLTQSYWIHLILFVDILSSKSMENLRIWRISCLANFTACNSCNGIGLYNYQICTGGMCLSLTIFFLLEKIWNSSTHRSWYLLDSLC